MKSVEHIVLRDVDIQNIGQLEVYEKQGGYQALRQILTQHTPEEIIDLVKRSGLRGRGGAGFPTGAKWGFVPKDTRPQYLIVNADESEPGTFKDRQIIERNPHQMLEGSIISAYAIGANVAYIYIRGEFAYGARVLGRAIAEAHQRGYLGQRIFGTDYALDIYLHRGAGAYICGEETALLESLEGRLGMPRLKPPFPAVVGLYNKPTVINNVETLANIPLIVERGPEWFRQYGTEKSPGTKVFSLCGHVNGAGNYELPLGTPLRELIYEYGGGIPGHRAVKAVVPGGASAPILSADHLDVGMDFESLAQAGSMLGSGGVIVIDETACVVRAAWKMIRFFKHESCGKCTPCREGTYWLSKVLEDIERGGAREADISLAGNIASQMVGRCFCPLGEAAVSPVLSSLKYFQAEYEEHLRLGRCPYPNGVPASV
ncbi:MAG: NADH-quinone oxidoreductase subunit NuoF [Chloroflexi bacterium]|nr:NADH-quinone oxidoreductase subunit NuoF [Chloroflexota bacterium]